MYQNIYENDKTVIDTANITNENFLFRSHIKTPCFASLTLEGRKNDYFTLYVDPTDMSIVGRADSLRNLAVRNSGINRDDALLKRGLKDVYKREERNRTLFDQAFRNKRLNVLDSLDAEVRKVLQKKRETVPDFAKENPNSLRSAMVILEHFRFYTATAQVQSLYTLLRPE